MLFLDRREAGQRLAVVVKERGLASPVVLGIPGGGVPVAIEVARAIGGEAGVVVARKLGAPANPELAIGATTSTGVTYMNTAVAAAAGAAERSIATERGGGWGGARGARGAAADCRSAASGGGRGHLPVRGPGPLGGWPVLRRLRSPERRRGPRDAGRLRRDAGGRRPRRARRVRAGRGPAGRHRPTPSGAAPFHRPPGAALGWPGA